MHFRQATSCSGPRVLVELLSPSSTVMILCCQEKGNPCLSLVLASLNGNTESMDMSLSKFWEMVKDQEVWHAVVHGVPKSWTWFSNWTTIFLKCKSNQVPPSPALDLPASLSRDPHSILRDCRAQWQFSMHFCVPHLTVNSVCTTLPSVLSVKSCTYWKPNKWVRIQWRFSR